MYTSYCVVQVFEMTIVKRRRRDSNDIISKLRKSYSSIKSPNAHGLMAGQVVPTGEQFKAHIPDTGQVVVHEELDSCGCRAGPLPSLPSATLPFPVDVIKVRLFRTAGSCNQADGILHRRLNNEYARRQ